MSFIVLCADCGIELRLLKDSTEGKRCYCGNCWEKRKNAKGN